MKQILLVFLIFTAFYNEAVAQHLVNNRKKFNIPFTYENNFIIINIQFDDALPLKFVFDTGAEYTILTKREFADMIGLRYEKEFRIMGADMSTILTAYLARNVHLKVGPIENPRQDFLVMGEDYFEFESFTGIEVHGIIGANFFGRYVVRIDYKRQLITLYDPQHFKVPKNFEAIPISIYKRKPYIEVSSKLFPQDSTANIRLLIDSGASLTLLLYTDTHPALNLPDKIVRANIGRGLGGTMNGFMGRLHELELGDQFRLNNLIANYHDITEYMDSSEINNRNGLIGNKILSRFEVIIDYHRELLYLKPNRDYRKKFRFDRSGLVFLASGKNLSTFTVSYVVPNSPAEEAGFRKGDRIKKVNWWSAGYMSMEGLTHKLQGRAGKEIRMTIIRDGITLKKKFKLRDII